MHLQPGPDRSTAVAGEMVSDQVEVTLWIGAVKRRREGEIAADVA
jgi:hypothetical protein